MQLGLVLTGGGALGAYQAGVLRGIAELSGERTLPFRVVAGTSAGSINAMALTAHADDFQMATHKMWRLWSELTPARVFETAPLALAKNGAGWMVDLGLGGLVGSRRGRSLLDTRPLRGFLLENFELEAIGRNARNGLIRGVAVTATSFESGFAVSFFDGAADLAPWTRSTRMGVRATLRIEHVLASAAIPIFFPAVDIDGSFYLDGCVRLSTPLSPAVHLGADRILAIGVRRLRQEVPEEPPERAYPSKAETAGLLLNALFMDALESDVERAERINRTVRLIPSEQRRGQGAAPPLRELELLVIQPSVDLGLMVRETFDRLPPMLRHFLRGLGVSDDSGKSLLSYLSFDSAYTLRLLEVGRRDAHAARERVLAFLGRDGRSSGVPTPPTSGETVQAA